MEPILTKNHLAKMIKNCIDDLDGGGSKLFDLAHLFHCIGEVSEKSIYDAFVPIVGSLGGEIVTFRPIVSLPILPEPTRDKYQKIFNDAIKESKEALSILKTELCEKNSIDPNQIIKALSILGKHDYNLGIARSSLVKPPSSMGAMVSEE